MRKDISGPKVEAFLDWRGIRKYLASCDRHHWRIEFFLRENAKDAVDAHEACYHGRVPHKSEWTLQNSGRL